MCSSHFIIENNILRKYLVNLAMNKVARVPILPIDRQKVVILRQQGFSMREITGEIGRNHSDVVRIWNRYRVT